MTIQELRETLGTYPADTEVVMACGEGVYYTPLRLYMSVEGEIVIDAEENYGFRPGEHIMIKSGFIFNPEFPKEFNRVNTDV